MDLQLHISLGAIEHVPRVDAVEGFAGVAADDTKLGAMLAESVVDVIIKGKPISAVPVKMDPDPKITINENMMKGLDLKFPEAILQKAQMVR